MTKGSKFDDFLKDENIEIDEEIIKEVTELKEEIADLEDLARYKTDCIVKLEKENAELKAENERLKEENKTLEQFLSKEPLALQALQKGYASYKESTDVFYQMVKTYKQTLQEIREYAECVGNEEMINGYAIRAKSALWRIANMITKAEEE